MLDGFPPWQTVYGTDPAVVANLETGFLVAAPQVFDQQKGVEKPVTDETGPLYEQIGRLQMELNWLKKISDQPQASDEP